MFAIDYNVKKVPPPPTSSSLTILESTLMISRVVLVFFIFLKVERIKSSMLWADQLTDRMHSIIQTYISWGFFPIEGDEEDQ